MIWWIILAAVVLLWSMYITHDVRRSRKEGPVYRSVLLAVINHCQSCSTDYIICRFRPFTTLYRGRKTSPEFAIDWPHEARIRGYLHQLVTRGYVAESKEGYFSLTEQGIEQFLGMRASRWFAPQTDAQVRNHHAFPSAEIAA
ncbi:MAG: hypothetical protein Q8P82_02095 [bacterium]|nr:hypothetical protein [bacterium]